MAETIFKTSDPIIYKANNIYSLDKRIVQAFIANDTNRIEEIINSGLPLTMVYLFLLTGTRTLVF